MKKPRLTCSSLLLLVLGAGPAVADPTVVSVPLTTPVNPPVSAPPAPEAQPGTQAAPVQSQAANGMVWQLYQQVQQLQDQVQQLQGALEQQSHALERLQADDKSRYNDTDQRLSDVETKLKQATATAPANTVASGPAAVAPQPQPVEDTVDVDEQKKAYLAAYDIFRTQGPDQAIPPMLTFVGKYPQSLFAANAQYWLGMFYLAATPPNLDEAKRHLTVVTTQYGDNPKASTALFQLAQIAHQQSHEADARSTLRDLLARYPASAEASKAQAYLAKPPAPVAPAETAASAKATASKADSNKSVAKPSATPRKPTSDSHAQASSDSAKSSAHGNKVTKPENTSSSAKPHVKASHKSADEGDLGDGDTKKRATNDN